MLARAIGFAAFLWLWCGGLGSAQAPTVRPAPAVPSAPAAPAAPAAPSVTTRSAVATPPITIRLAGVFTEGASITASMRAFTSAVSERLGDAASWRVVEPRGFAFDMVRNGEVD